MAAAHPPMNLYLMRHANAGLKRDNPLLDARRGLIKEGKEQCMLMARLLLAQRAQIDVVLSSPLKRSLQTAQLVATEIDYDAPVIATPALNPGAEFSDFLELMTHYRNCDGVLAVGHNPDLFRFLGHLISGNGGAAVRMRKAAIARLNMDRHPPILHWLIDPRTAAAIFAAIPRKVRRKSSKKS